MKALISGLLVGLVGRPILKIIKWLRWCFLLAGLAFNSVEIYDPAAKAVVSSHFTILPFAVGFALFCIGLTIKRYDEISSEFYSIIPLTPEAGK